MSSVWWETDEQKDNILYNNRGLCDNRRNGLDFLFEYILIRKQYKIQINSMGISRGRKFLFSYRTTLIWYIVLMISSVLSTWLLYNYGSDGSISLVFIFFTLPCRIRVNLAKRKKNIFHPKHYFSCTVSATLEPRTSEIPGNEKRTKVVNLSNRTAGIRMHALFVTCWCVCVALVSTNPPGPWRKEGHEKSREQATSCPIAVKKNSFSRFTVGDAQFLY